MLINCGTWTHERWKTSVDNVLTENALQIRCTMSNNKIVLLMHMEYLLWVLNGP